MVLTKTVSLDGALLAAAAMTKAGAEDAKACRKQRRRALAEVAATRTLPMIRAEAIRSLQRSCGACGACRGV